MCTAVKGVKVRGPELSILAGPSSKTDLNEKKGKQFQQTDRTGEVIIGSLSNE